LKCCVHCDGLGFEGGGDTAQQKAELRTGLDQLLDAQKKEARAKRLRWKLVPSGGRDSSFTADGYLFLTPGEKEELLNRELAAARRAGLNDVEKVARAPLSSFDTGPCLRYPNQGPWRNCGIALSNQSLSEVRRTVIHSPFQTRIPTPDFPEEKFNTRAPPVTR